MWVCLVVALVAAAAGTPQGLAVNGAVFLQFNPRGNASESLRDLSSVVGRGGWVSFVVTFGQTNVDSTTIAATADTLGAAQLTALVRQAQQLGLRTVRKGEVRAFASPTLAFFRRSSRTWT